MNKAFISYLIVFLATALLLACKNNSKEIENECENFQISGFFYQGEKVSVKFNSMPIHEDYFEDKAWSVLHRFCLEYTDSFQIGLKITKGNRVVLDTTMVGYSKNGNYRLNIPRGDPKSHLIETVWADTTGTLYNQIPTDSLVRTASLKIGLIVTD